MRKPSRQVFSLLTDPAGQHRLWREMADLGWIGAAFPEAVGGYGSSPVDALVVSERLGAHLVTQPFVITAVVCGRLLTDGLEGDRRAEAIAPVIAGTRQLALMAGGAHVLRSPQDGALAARRSGEGHVLDGRMAVVINGDRADQLLVAARTHGHNGEREGVTLFLVDADAPGVSRRPMRMIDGHGADRCRPIAAQMMRLR